MNVNIKVSFQSVHNFFKLLSHQMRHVHEARGDSDERKKKYSDLCSDSSICSIQSCNYTVLWHANHTVLWHAYLKQIISIIMQYAEQS